MPKHKLCILVYSPFKNLRRRKKAGSGCLKIIIINSSSAWPLHTQVLSLPLLLHFSWEKRAIYYFWFMYGKLPSTLPPFSSAYEWSLRTRMSIFFFWLIHPHQAAKRGFFGEARPIHPPYHWIETSSLKFCLQGPNFISSQHNNIYKSAVKPILNPCLSLELLNPATLPLAVSCLFFMQV